MVIELRVVQFGLNHTRDFKIERARSANSIWNHKYDFRLKLHDPKFNYHFIRSILKTHNFMALKGQSHELRMRDFLPLGALTQ